MKKMLLVSNNTMKSFIYQKNVGENAMENKNAN